MSDFDDFAKSNEAQAVYKKAAYAKHRWQHEAVVYADRLGIKPDNQWFKFFKQHFYKHEPKFRSILEQASNPNIKKKDKYFYFMFYNGGRNANKDKSPNNN